MPLSDTTVKNAKLLAKETERILADGLGLYLRVRPGSSKSWIFRHTYNGRRKKVVLGSYPEMSLKEARAARLEQSRILESGRSPVLQRAVGIVAKRGAITVADLAREFNERFLEPRYERPKDAYDALKRDVIKGLHGDTLAQDVTTPMLTRVFNAMVDRGAKVGANRTLALARLMFQYGVDQHYLPANPVTMTQKAVGGREQAKKTNLLFEQIAAFLGLLNALDSPMHPVTGAALKVVLGTAKRPLEVVTMEWSHVDLTARRWLNPWQLTKDKVAGKDHLVFLNQWTVNVLDQLRAAKLDDRYVFPSPQKLGRKDLTPIRRHSLSEAILRAHDDGVLKAKFTPHDLRRTFASRAAQLKIAPHVVEKCLDHVMVGMMAVYNHADYFEERLEAMDRWGAKLAELELVGSCPTSVVTES